MSGLMVYFFIILDNIKELLLILSALSFAILFLLAVIGFLHNLMKDVKVSLKRGKLDNTEVGDEVAIPHTKFCDQDNKDKNSSTFFFSKPTILIYTLLIILNMFLFTAAKLLPSTKQMAAIYMIPKVINNEVPDNLIKWLNDYIKKDLKNNNLEEDLENRTKNKIMLNHNQ